MSSIRTHQPQTKVISKSKRTFNPLKAYTKSKADKKRRALTELEYRLAHNPSKPLDGFESGEDFVEKVKNKQFPHASNPTAELATVNRYLSDVYNNEREPLDISRTLETDLSARSKRIAAEITTREERVKEFENHKTEKPYSDKDENYKTASKQIQSHEDLNAFEFLLKPLKFRNKEKLFKSNEFKQVINNKEPILLKAFNIENSANIINIKDDIRKVKLSSDENKLEQIQELEEQLASAKTQALKKKLKSINIKEVKKGLVTAKESLKKSILNHTQINTKSAKVVKESLEKNINWLTNKRDQIEKKYNASYDKDIKKLNGDLKLLRTGLARSNNNQARTEREIKAAFYLEVYKDLSNQERPINLRQFGSELNKYTDGINSSASKANQKRIFNNPRPDEEYPKLLKNYNRFFIKKYATEFFNKAFAAMGNNMEPRNLQFLLKTNEKFRNSVFKRLEDLRISSKEANAAINNIIKNAPSGIDKNEVSNQIRVFTVLVKEAYKTTQPFPEPQTIDVSIMGNDPTLSKTGVIEIGDGQTGFNITETSAIPRPPSVGSATTARDMVSEEEAEKLRALGSQQEINQEAQVQVEQAQEKEKAETRAQEFVQSQFSEGIRGSELIKQVSIKIVGTNDANEKNYYAKFIEEYTPIAKQLDKSINNMYKGDINGFKAAYQNLETANEMLKNIGIETSDYQESEKAGANASSMALV